MIDHTPDRCGYVSDDPEVTSRHRADGWRCAKGADHKGSHILYTAEGEQVLHSDRWKRGNWIPAAPEHAPTLPRKVENHGDLIIGQRVSIEHIYSKTRSLTHTGLVSDVMLEGVNLEGLVDVRALADPHFDVEITVLAEAPEPEPEAWIVQITPSLDVDEGSSMVGPFATRAEAEDHALQQRDPWGILPLYAPKEAN